MKKYRPGFLYFILLFIDLLCIFSFLLAEKANLLFLVLGIIAIIVTLFILPFYISVADDNIEFKQFHFVSKTNQNPYKRKETWLSFLKNKTIKFEDVVAYRYSLDNRYIVFVKKDNDRVIFPIILYNRELRKDLEIKFNKYNIKEEQ